jgi:hypothetical protein
MGPRNVRESRRLIPVFNEIGIRNNKGGSKKTERILADTLSYVSRNDISLQLVFWRPIKGNEECKTKKRKTPYILYHSYNKVG